MVDGPHGLVRHFLLDHFCPYPDEFILKYKIEWVDFTTDIVS